MSRVFIIGAGYVAGKAAGLLHARGHQVSLGKRHPESGLPEELSPQISVHRMDVGEPASFPAALLEADTLIYCVSSDGFSPEQYRRAYVDGMFNLLSHLDTCGLATDPVVAAREQPQGTPRAGTRKLIFVSSTGVFSQDDGSQVDENSETLPKAFSGQLMLEAEKLVQEFSHRHPGFQGCSVRFSGIYGPGRTRMVEDIRAGKPVSEKRWQQLTNRIHRDDCAGVLVHLVEQARTRPTYVASDLHPARFGDIAQWVAGELGIAPPAILSGLALASPAAASSGGLERGGHKQCWSTGLLAEGYQFKFPGFKDGYAHFVGNIA